MYPQRNRLRQCPRMSCGKKTSFKKKVKGLTCQKSLTTKIQRDNDQKTQGSSNPKTSDKIVKLIPDDHVL